MLTDLKKTGVLERDAVLRKTTFDECKGDKFEELLSGFANVVLRQQLRERASIALPSSIESETDRLSLILAHRVSLRAKLDQRQILAAKVLDHEQDISGRRDRLSRTKKELQRHRPPDAHVRGDTECLLRDSWTADPIWINALLRDPPPVSSQPDQKTAQAFEHDAKPVLQGLQDLISQQEAQLRRWAAFKSSLPTANAGPPEPQEHPPRARPVLCFDKHKALCLENSSTKAFQNAVGTSEIQRQYDDLLILLSSALCSDEPSYSARELEVDAGAATPVEHVRLESVSAGRSRASTSVPLEADRTLPPTSQRDQQDVGGDVSFGQSSKIESSPLREQISVQAHLDDETISPECSWLAPTPMPANATTNHSSTPKVADASEQAAQPLPQVTPLPKRGPTLQERTRMSMAGALRDIDNIPTSPIVRKQKASKREDFATPPLEEDDEAGNLAQRTRKSMSLLTTIADMKTSRRKSKGSRVSQLYPVDPFETPRRSSSRISLQTPGSNDSTPREKLFSEDADITSVFKSRPKIAMSPMISPTRSLLDEDSILASRSGNLYLDDDEDDMEQSP